VHGEEATLGEKRASFPAEAVVAGHSKARNVHDAPRCDLSWPCRYRTDFSR
jgi:hypothetical protein